MELVFQDQGLDAFFAIHVLHHTEKREWHFRNIPRALDEVRRALKIGRVFVDAELFNKGQNERLSFKIGFLPKVHGELVAV